MLIKLQKGVYKNELKNFANAGIFYLAYWML